MTDGTQVDTFFSPPNPQLDYAKLYVALEPSRKQVRLLELLPGGHEQPICCRLIQKVDLTPIDGSENSVSFEALSYRAGAPNDYRHITIDGFHFNTFATSFGALKEIRLRERSRIIWVDQICINQTNIPERNRQVEMMAEIYRTAARVLIWTGERCSLTKSYLVYDFVADVLKMHGTALRRAVNRYTIEVKSESSAVKRWLEPFFVGRDLTQSSSNLDLQQCHDFLVQMFCDPNSLATLEALGHFFRRPYWRRMWIVQEIVLSADATILCGSDSCGLQDFLLVVAVMLSVAREKAWDVDNTLLPNFLKRARRILAAWVSYTHCIFQVWHRIESQPLHLLSLLSLTDEFCSTDPRDRIYALLGLLPQRDKLKLGIIIDYSRNNTPVQTLLHVASNWIKSDSGLLILGSVRGDEIKLGLPSWVPNLLRNERFCSKGVYDMVHEAGWKACGSTQVQARFYGGESILSLEGTIIGQLQSKCRLGVVDSSIRQDEYRIHTEVVQSWQQLIADDSAATTPTTWHEFWRTLSMDSFAEVRNEENPALWESQYMLAVKGCRGRFTRGRKFAILPNGLMGLFPHNCQHGDLVVIFCGGHVPFVIREHSGVPLFQLIGECYIRKIMYGHVMDYLGEGSTKIVKIALA